jgi:hypothetical protein
MKNLILSRGMKKVKLNQIQFLLQFFCPRQKENPQYFVKNQKTILIMKN